MSKTPESNKKAAIKYKAANVKRIYLDLNKKTDADLINYLEDIPNKAGHIKKVLREKIKSDQK